MKYLWLQASVFFWINFLAYHQLYEVAHRRLLYKWIAIEFDYSNEEAKDEAIKRGQYIPTNVIITDADYHAPTDRYFIATPPFRNGVPATLSQVINEVGIFKPFPSWSNYNTRRSCRGPFSVIRFHIDKCGYMWVIDSGRDEIVVPNGNKLICPPKLLMYDLNYWDREILRYEFPDDVVKHRTVLNNIVTECYRDDCSDSFAYIADEQEYGLIVFDYARRKSWRIENQYFYPFPSAAVVTVNNVTGPVMAGIFGLALGPRSEPERKLYFHSFSSVRESWVPLGILKNITMARDQVVSRTAFVLSPGERAGQSSAEVMTEDGILIYALTPENAIACWNMEKPFTIENQHIIDKDDEDFQSISGMKLKNNRLLITSNRYQNFIIGSTNGTDFKYRVMVIENVNHLLKSTPCASTVDYGNNYSDEEYIAAFDRALSNVQFDKESFGESKSRFSSSGSHGRFSYAVSHGKTDPVTTRPKFFEGGSSTFEDERTS